MKIQNILLSLLMSSLADGRTTLQPNTRALPQKFRRVFCWGTLTDEETAKKYSEIGVTDICVNDRSQLGLALKYGITPYCGVFSPHGKHGQVMSQKEEEHFAYINTHDLEGMTEAEKKKTRDQRRIEMKHRYGGEPVATLDTLNSIRIPCFVSDTNYERSKSAIDEICSRVQGVKGIFFDYLGYSNFKGCYCQDCLEAYEKYREQNKLGDSQKTRDVFYRDMLVQYYNDMIDYVKNKRPGFKVVIHVYPTFLPEPLYGNRTKADFCGQTVAWYFPWASEKIARYTRITIGDQNKYFQDVQGVPFVGLNRNPGSLWVKDAATLEQELQVILEAGGDMLMVCDGNDMIKPEIYPVFKKFCGKG